ncbi:hemerythrin domain-containing protein [Terrabacter sp. GCM10028922]|uniref:hemerythrin domain-containing protein n=1 Tax=Terrabacter sp. GCM10028922 TaxID=3273428 RepID=UPI00360D7424
MTGPMTMNRVIHAAVRRDLGRLASALPAAPDGDRARARQLQVAYANLHDQLKDHHEGEDRHVFPFLARVEGATELVGVMETEHQAMADALAGVRTAMDTYASTGSADDAHAAREAVVRANEVVERHLHHEENDLEPLMLPHLETPEWKAVEKQLRPASLTDSGRFMAWVQDGMPEAERAYLRSTIPAPVTFLLSRLAGRSYYRDVAPAWQPTR